jgi:hypothetical protein
VDVDDGSGNGPVPAPDGTKITFSIVSGPGSFVGNNQCNTNNHTGSCTAVITSPSPGTTVVRAATDVNVNGQTFHRETNDGGVNDSPDAQKQWVGVGPCVLGYPDSSHNPRSSAAFNESTVLVGAQLFGTGAGQYIGVFTDDEHALTLGAGPTVTPYPGSPPNGGFPNPNVGTLTAADPFGRPIFPSAFVTDITSNPSSRAGDWQQQNDNTTAKSPSTIFGSWKGATLSGGTITPGPDPAQNKWNLGTGADTPPTTSSQGYNSEVEWTAASLGLQSGHSYRVQVIVHDGDQNQQGGDVGQACVNVTIP